MKKLFLILAVLLIPTLVKAEPVDLIENLKKIPSLKQGIAYDIADSKINYLSTVGVIKYSDCGLDVGYSSNNKAVAVLSYDIGGLKKLGLDTPITNLIDVRVGFYAGYGRLTGSNEFSYGPTVTVIDVKF